jgi:epoxyqueuosine reductase
MNAVDFSALDAAGLNLQAVFDLAALPAEMRAALDPQGAYRRLILVGHGGRTLWERVQATGLASDDPIDDFTRATVRAWLGAQLPGCAHALVYPGDAPVGLQALGRLAGWHHESPFRVGVNAAWGSWFAYRAVLLVDADLPVTPALAGESPCAACAGQPCVSACPADALREREFSLAKCIAYRRQPDSRCRVTCVARTSCPVRPEHRYDDAQIAHSYSRSLAMIERWG